MYNEWNQYLKNISWTYRERVQSTWLYLTTAIPTIRIPYAGTSPDEQSFFFVWDNGNYYIELEILSDSFEWFYRNRLTNELAGSEHSVESIEEVLLEYLRKYAI